MTQPVSPLNRTAPSPPGPDSTSPAERAWSLAARPPIRGRLRGSTDVGWAFIRPEVLESCSIALRRMGDADVGSIAVTSTSRREGRTTVAVALAATAAIALHRRTILLDLDLERAGVEKLVSVGPAPGAAEFLHGDLSIDECLQRVDRDIEIMPAGALGASADVTARIGRLGELIEQLRDRCDVLIADLPPLNSGIVAARIADLFDSVTLVVRAGAVDVSRIEQTLSIVHQRPFVILNGVGSSQTSWIRRIRRIRPRL
jgi:Mrp family chromosome partitioning ATPase